MSKGKLWKIFRKKLRCLETFAQYCLYSNFHIMLTYYYIIHFNLFSAGIPSHLVC